MATTDNKQNCRIGWITDKGGTSVRITTEGYNFVYERKLRHEREYSKSYYDVYARGVIRGLLRFYPYHPVLIELQNHIK